MAETHFDEWIAQHYETLWPELFDAEVIESTVAFLADLVGRGAALEFGIGTGRIAIPLARRGVPVHGIELSSPMITQLRARDGGSSIGVTRGDFASASVNESFSVVYVLRNAVTNLTSQDEQVACFANAARHLRRGGAFVVENYVPELRRIPPGQRTLVFTATPTHIGVDDYDIVNQLEISRHWWLIDGDLKTMWSPHRFVWPAELDLMARLAGMTLRERWGAWRREPFTADSREHISVWEKND